MRPRQIFNWPDNRTNQHYFRVFGGPITVLLYIYTKGFLCLEQDRNVIYARPRNLELMGNVYI